MTDGRAVFVRWAKEHAIALTTTDPAGPLDDLDALAPLLSSTPLVCLGEATHGTREFFDLKHRLIRWLVERDPSIGALLFEASHPEGVAVDRHVRTGIGEPARAVAGMRFWVWDTEEVVGLVRWLRKANLDRLGAGVPAVRFVGVDVQFPAGSARTVVRSLLADGSSAADAAAADLLLLTDDTGAGLVGRMPGAIADSRRGADAAAEVLGETDALRVLRQGIELASRGADIWQVRERRDRAMATNVVAALDDLGAGGRAVVWAHNQHVARDGFVGRFRSQGGEVEAIRPASQTVVGFTFGCGGFTAVDLDSGRLGSFEVDVLADSFDAALDEVGLPLFALDLREVPAGSSARAWLASRPPCRSIGSGFRNGDRDGASATMEHDPAAQFDAVIHVSRATPSRLMPTAARTVPPDPVTLPALVNADFSAGPAGEAPPGWALTEARTLDGVRALTLIEDGEPVVLLVRGDPDWDFGTVTLGQRIDAAAARLRGRRATFDVAARTVAAGLGRAVRATLTAIGPSGAKTAVSPPLHPSGAVEHMTATLDVPTDAVTVDVGVALAGPGPVVINSVTLCQELP